MANNTGTFFNVNDNDGIPLVGVSTDGKVMINHLYGNCLIGSTSVTGTTSQPLQVTGGAYVSGNLGIGTTQPTVKLQVQGDGRFTGVVTATSFTGSLTGTASTANNVSSTININTTGIITASSFVGSLVGIASTATNALGLSATASINTSGIITASSFVGGLTGTASTATTALGLSTTASINTSGIITATGGFSIGIQSGGTNIATGVITAINFVGSGNTFSYNSTTKVVDVTIFSGGSSVSISTNTTNQTQYIPYVTSFGSTTGFGATTLLVYDPSNSNLGIGTTNPTAKVHIGAATTSNPGGAPLKIGAGTTILATPEVGAIEYDGSYLYQTPNSTSGRAYVPPVYSFRLTANGANIGATIADFFATPSSLSLEASSVYKITCFAYFTKTTAGTAIWTHTFSSAPTIFTSSLTYSPVTGIANGTQTNVLSYSGGQATASMDHAATASLTTGVNHFSRFELIAVTNAATNWRLRLTQSAGTATPLTGSFYTIEKVGPSTGTFVA